jgi:hypothetical protein
MTLDFENDSSSSSDSDSEFHKPVYYFTVTVEHINEWFEENQWWAEDLSIDDKLKLCYLFFVYQEHSKKANDSIEIQSVEQRLHLANTLGELLFPGVENVKNFVDVHREDEDHVVLTNPFFCEDDQDKIRDVLKLIRDDIIEDIKNEMKGLSDTFKAMLLSFVKDTNPNTLELKFLKLIVNTTAKPDEKQIAKEQKKERLLKEIDNIKQKLNKAEYTLEKCDDDMTTLLNALPNLEDKTNSADTLKTYGKILESLTDYLPVIKKLENINRLQIQIDKLDEKVTSSSLDKDKYWEKTIRNARLALENKQKETEVAKGKPTAANTVDSKPTVAEGETKTAESHPTAAKDETGFGSEESKAESAKPAIPTTATLEDERSKAFKKYNKFVNKLNENVDGLKYVVDDLKIAFVNYILEEKYIPDDLKLKTVLNEEYKPIVIEYFENVDMNSEVFSNEFIIALKKAVMYMQHRPQFNDDAATKQLVDILVEIKSLVPIEFYNKSGLQPIIIDALKKGDTAIDKKVVEKSYELYHVLGHYKDEITQIEDTGGFINLIWDDLTKQVESGKMSLAREIEPSKPIVIEASKAKKTFKDKVITYFMNQILGNVSTVTYNSESYKAMNKFPRYFKFYIDLILKRMDIDEQTLTAYLGSLPKNELNEGEKGVRVFDNVNKVLTKIEESDKNDLTLIASKHHIKIYKNNK